MTHPTQYILLDQADDPHAPEVVVVDGRLVAHWHNAQDDVASLVLLPVCRLLVAEIIHAEVAYVVVLEMPQADTSPLLAHLTEPPARGVPCAYTAVRVGTLAGDGDDAPEITADQHETLLVRVGSYTYPVRSLTVLPVSRLVLVECQDYQGCLAVVAFELSDEAADTAPTVTLTLTSDQAAMVVDTLRLIGDFVQEAARAEPYYDLAALVGQQVAHQIGGAA